MHDMQLSAIDMNLLVVLGALLETGSVKGAASRLGLSPSATSHALGRLRELLDDPVLVRAGQRMVPSARAEQLRPRVDRLLSDVVELLEPTDEVNPATMRRSFRLATTDYVDLLVVQPLSRRLAVEAPGVDLYCSPIPGAVERLRNEQIDLAFGVFPQLPEDIEAAPMIEEDLVCVLRKGHPRARGRFTRAQYAALGHVLTAPAGGTRAVVDTCLERHGLTRRVARTAPNFQAAAQLVEGTDYVLTLPRRIAERLCGPLDLVVRAPPLEVPPFVLEVIWHRRHGEDAAHRWLREQIDEIEL